jgi:hypothetical protein
MAVGKWKQITTATPDSEAATNDEELQTTLPKQQQKISPNAAVVPGETLASPITGYQTGFSRILPDFPRT